MGLSYKDAGVDISRQDESLAKIKELIAETQTEYSGAHIGGFGGLTAIDVKKYPQPVTVSSVDGVGTKLYIAYLVNKHNTVGYDLVSHCINDIFVQGADPLFFLDYISTSKLDPRVVYEIISGMVKACKENKCALIGGELAEMPGLYKTEEYDLVGSITGVVNRSDIIDGSEIESDDLVIGLPSIGLHTNGFSLARKILLEKEKLSVDSLIPGLTISVGDELLKSHKCYYSAVKALVEKKIIKGMAHITGGGLVDNLPRVLQKKFDAVIEPRQWPSLPIFNYLTDAGKIDQKEAYQVFNMGIGMTLIIRSHHWEEVKHHLSSRGEECYKIGEIQKGKGSVILNG